MRCCAELLSQLSNARSRAAAVRNVSAQLQQLELQLQSTRSESFIASGIRGNLKKMLSNDAFLTGNISCVGLY